MSWNIITVLPSPLALAISSSAAALPMASTLPLKPISAER